MFRSIRRPASLIDKGEITFLPTDKPSKPDFSVIVVLDDIKKLNDFEQVFACLGFRPSGQECLTKHLSMDQTALMWSFWKKAFEGGNKATMPVRGQTQDVVSRLSQPAKGVSVIKVIFSGNKIPGGNPLSRFEDGNTTPMAKILTIGF